MCSLSSNHGYCQISSIISLFKLKLFVLQGFAWFGAWSESLQLDFTLGSMEGIIFSLMNLVRQNKTCHVNEKLHCLSSNEKQLQPLMKVTLPLETPSINIQ